MKNKLGLLTIGQSPRTDITPTFKRIFGPDINLIEMGALDGLNEDEIRQLKPSDDENTLCVTRLSNGKSVKLSKDKLMSYIHKRICQLEKEAQIICILCTGDFKEVESDIFILYPDKIVKNFVFSFMGENNVLGVIVPDSSQKEMIEKKWQYKDFRVICDEASPYKESNIELATKFLVSEGVHAIILDCMGYNEEHKARVQRYAKVPVILPRTVTASLLKELF